VKACGEIHLTESDERRFWKYVNKTESCWLWFGSRMPRGYGTILLQASHRGGKRRLVHRVSWTLRNGQIPLGFCVCHHCDVPNCVNPSHLFLGTLSDNMKDAAKKGRLHCQKNPHEYRGESNSRSVLKDTDIRKIRSLKGKMTYREIGEIYNMTKGGIGHIMRGESWSHI